jgi:MFS family permease
MLIASMCIFSLFAMGIITLLPAWSVNVLGGDVKTNGLLLSARGAGALIGALAIASMSRYNVKGKLWTVGSFALPAVLLAFTITRWLPLSMLMLVGFGASQMIMINTSNAIIQMSIPDHLRGRVMSIYMLAFFGFMPLGSLLTGSLAARIGEPTTVLLNSLVLLVYGGLVWMRQPVIRGLE